eukprot:scaffold102555_cov75-Phaeocystis_antarctica.AAC.1
MRQLLYCVTSGQQPFLGRWVARGRRGLHRTVRIDRCAAREVCSHVDGSPLFRQARSRTRRLLSGGTRLALVDCSNT